MKRPLSELLKRRGVLIHVGPQAAVAEAAALMDEHNVSALVVLNDAGDAVGIVTERDLTRRVVAKQRPPAETPVRAIMTEDVVVVSEDTPRDEALNLMHDRHIRHLPVASDDQLVGMISIRDLLHFENRMKEQTIEDLRDYVLEKPYPRYPR
ncbi:CBS domain-containing protein [Salisaeta longa]|uniref:CBS domain-containing protein n=1 Tax=Salisaeta longa TaxID=503170 RepID=UPI00058EFF07|nr:CBS domain-containing protein [Salisaeta longa]